MANRMICYLEVDPIIIDCRCGRRYVLYFVSATDGNREMRFLQEQGRPRFCPYCGRDYRTPEEKLAMDIQEGSCTCPTCKSTIIVKKGAPATCTVCDWSSR